MVSLSWRLWPRKERKTMPGPDLERFITLDADPWMGVPFNASTSESHWEVIARRYLLVAKRVEEATLKSKGPPVRILLFIVGLLSQYPKNSVTVSLEQLKKDVGPSEDPNDSVVVADLPVAHRTLASLLGNLCGERVRVWKFMVAGEEPCLVLDEPDGQWRAFLMGLDRVHSSSVTIKLNPEGDQKEPQEQVGPEESDDLEMDEVFNQWS